MHTATHATAGLPLSQLVLNLITVGTQHSLDSVLDACVRHGIGAVSPWRAHYADIGVQRAAAALRARGLAVNTVCRMADFGPADTAAAWQRAIDEARVILDEAVALGAQSITVTGGGVSANSPSLDDARQRILEGVQTILPEARAAGVVLAIEALHPMCAADRGAINSIRQACALATAAGDGAKLMVDTYNTWWDPDLAAALAAAEGLICGFQVSDWLVPTTDLAFDRGMMGDGVIHFRRMRQMAADAGYTGPVEVEILSHRWSARPIDEVLSTVTQRFAAVC